jgi:2-polyprenyl-6-methoxyphenol hydroxylase-like FAD-dependent oxidoreductase
MTKYDSKIEMRQKPKAHKCSASLRHTLKSDEHSEGVSASLRIGIIGGGLAGLACAICLRQLGLECTVYERDENFADRKQGYGLTLTNNRSGPLETLELLDKLVELDCPSSSHWVFGRSGQVLGYYGRAFLKSNKKEGNGDFSRGNLRIPRQILRQLLLDKVEGGIKWGYKFKTFTESENGVEVQFEGKDSIQVDILIGADGIRSLVRQKREIEDSIWTHNISELKYTGVSVILGLSSLCPLKNPLIFEKGFYMLDGKHRLFTMPFRKESQDQSLGPLTMWQLSFDVEEEFGKSLSRKPQKLILEEALHRCKSCFEPISSLISNTPLCEVWSTPLYDRDTMPVRPKDRGSRVVVVGDAAHPMSMFKGQGANQAIQDAPLLAKWLGKLKSGTERKSLLTSLRCFEREMTARASPKVQASREAALMLHSSPALSQDFGIEGYEGDTASLLERLCSMGIEAGKTENLEYEVGRIIDGGSENSIE